MKKGSDELVGDIIALDIIHERNDIQVGIDYDGV